MNTNSNSFFSVYFYLGYLRVFRCFFSFFLFFNIFLFFLSSHIFPLFFPFFSHLSRPLNYDDEQCSSSCWFFFSLSPLDFFTAISGRGISRHSVHVRGAKELPPFDCYWSGLAVGCPVRGTIAELPVGAMHTQEVQRLYPVALKMQLTTGLLLRLEQRRETTTTTISPLFLFFFLTRRIVSLPPVFLW